MASGIRKNAKAKKIFYKIMNTPKDLQQDTQIKPSAKTRYAWYVDSLMTQ